jgi:L-cysteine S-thiosulfotransferase
VRVAWGSTLVGLAASVSRTQGERFRQIRSVMMCVVVCVGLATVILGGHPDARAAEPLARRSATLDLSRDTRAMQDDDSLNPATFWRLDGEALWRERVGEANRSCASCHGEAPDAMKGVAVQFPKMVAGQLLNLEGQINRCRSMRQGASPLAFESNPLLSMAVFIGAQSRGQPIAPARPMDPVIPVPTLPQSRPLTHAGLHSDFAWTSLLEAGRALYIRRMGQLNLACVHCHDERAGARLGGNLIPQAHPTGYPIYRLEWNAVGSLQRRLRNCMIGVRAEPFAFGAPELVQLELYLMERARGMDLETPGVRP